MKAKTEMDRSGTDDIGLMTLAAAYEVDLRLAGKRPNVNIFRNLGRCITEMSGQADQSHAAFLHSDPKAIQVLVRAVEESSLSDIEDVATLLEKIRDIIEPLQKDEVETDRVVLERFKNFCLSLHRAIITTKVPEFSEWGYDSDGEIALYRS